MFTTTLRLIGLIVLCSTLLVSACKIEKNRPAAEAAEDPDAFNPNAMVVADWQQRIIPYLSDKSADFDTVRALEVTDIAAAGKRYGHKPEVGNTPWTFAVRFTGKIIEANTESRASTITLDTNADGKPDVSIQIGPVIRGTAVRDSLDFVSFNDFVNQIEYAQYGKAFNTHIRDQILSDVPRETLSGATASGLGVYQYKKDVPVPLVTPVQLSVETAQ